MHVLFFFSSRRRHTRFDCDWSSDVCSSDLRNRPAEGGGASRGGSSSWGTQYRESGAWDAPPGKDNGLYTPSKSPAAITIWRRGGRRCPPTRADRKSGVEGKRVDLGGRRIIKK